MELNKFDYYDLDDLNFGWRGRYRIIKQDPQSELVQILNLATGSKQFVSANRLRKSRCEQFFIRGLAGR